MRGPSPNNSKTEGSTVSVVVPAYKEEEYIEATLKGIAEVLRAAKIAFEIIVVIDLTSDDGTSSRVREVAQRYSEIRVLERKGRRGVGDAVRSGIREAEGKIVVPVMGDQSEHPSDLVTLVRKAEDCDVVFTDRFRHGRPPGYPILKYVANRCCNFAAALLFQIPYADTTNAFKAYTKQLLNRIELSSRGFEIFLEMPVKAMMLAPRTDEIEVIHFVRKKQAPKLSIVRDGYRYACLMLCLLRRARVAESPNRACQRYDS
jgi:glycosyltransferase involved in cell wall biosynthesis